MADASQGNGPPQGSQGEGENAPKFLTADEVNKAITARLSAFEKKFGESMKSSLDGFSSSLGTMLDERFAALKPKSEGQGQPPQPSDIENHPVVKGLMKRLDEADKRTKTFQEERDQERGRARDSELRRRLGDELAKHGIPSDRVRQAVGLLVDADKRVRWGDDDSIVFHEKDGAVDLETGMKGWIKGDDAQIFLPPRGTSGSGDRGGGKKPPTQGQGYERGSLGRALVEEYAPGITVVPNR